MITYDSGVQKIDVDIESGEITVTGKFESKEIHTLIEKISKKKVEMTSVKAIKKETEKVSFEGNFIEFSVVLCTLEGRRNGEKEEKRMIESVLSRKNQLF